MNIRRLCLAVAIVTGGLVLAAGPAHAHDAFPPGPTVADVPPGPYLAYPPGPSIADYPPGPTVADYPPGPTLV
jgi:hypothetical protein